MANRFSDFKEALNKKVEDIKKTAPEQVDKLEDMVNQYQNLNPQELMQEFLKESKRKKDRGELNNNELSNIKNTLSPFLNDEQKQHLNKLMETIYD